MFKYIVTEENKYFNIKELLKVHYDMSDKLIARLKKHKRIFKNNNPVYVTEKLFLNDIVEIDLDFDEESDNIITTNKDIEIIYEDEYMLIVNKEPGYPVHPTSTHLDDTLSNAVKYYFVKNNIKRKIRPVNRLDKDTSGLVIFAKSDYIQDILIKQMEKNVFSKKYFAILENIPSPLSGQINAPIARKENSIIEREVTFNDNLNLGKDYLPQDASTLYNTKKIYESEDMKLALVEFKLLTGRTHQIRLHSKYISCPILGDSLYNKKSNYISRQALHSYEISFIHPITKKSVTFTAPIPKDIQNILDLFNFKTL